MGIKATLKSPKFYWGAAAGMIAGPAVLNWVRRATGVGLSLPKVGG
jgi:hypothetical protein